MHKKVELKVVDREPINKLLERRSNIVNEFDTKTSIGIENPNATHSNKDDLKKSAIMLVIAYIKVKRIVETFDLSQEMTKILLDKKDSMPCFRPIPIPPHPMRFWLSSTIMANVTCNETQLKNNAYLERLMWSAAIMQLNQSVADGDFDMVVNMFELQATLEKFSDVLEKITDPDRLVETQKLLYSYVTYRLPNESITVVAHIDEIF